MSEEIINASKQLNTQILNSEEYQKYILYKKELDGMPEIKARVSEFREKNFKMHLENQNVYSEQLANLENEYREVMAMPLVTSYLNAELGFCRMMQKVTKNIYKDFEMDIDFV